ncbi:SPARC-like [Corticium candelabrum]|uniref:SPARC-like n=1 Tax=Corticium candelabrum TaxID=121492 RepID=UPI002E25BA63|nr:SPARC-like [Corticium candelabrum]
MFLHKQERSASSHRLSSSRSYCVNREANSAYTSRIEMSLFAVLLLFAFTCVSDSGPVPAPASNGVTGVVAGPFDSHCRIRVCGRSKLCVIDGQGREFCVCKTCPVTSSRKSKPVCGTDGQTYPSKCALRYQRCSTRSKTLKQAHKGECLVSKVTDFSEKDCSAKEKSSFTAYFMDRLLDEMQLMETGRISSTVSGKFGLLSKIQQNAVINWQFAAADQNPKDEYLSPHETNRLYSLVPDKKACLIDLLSSCDIDNNGRHSRAELRFCLLQEH